MVNLREDIRKLNLSKLIELRDYINSLIKYELIGRGLIEVR